MLRLIIVLVLIVSAPLQGFARGGVEVTSDEQSSISLLLALSVSIDVEADDKKCCHQTELSDKKPSICTSDCKAVISAVIVAALKNPSDLDRPQVTIDASFNKPVDLRPPIS